MVSSDRVISINCSLIDVMKKIESSKIFSFCVVDERNVVLGVVSEGDIRRHFIRERENSFSCDLGGVIRRDFVSQVLGERIDHQKLAVLRDRGIEFVPVIDSRGHLVRIVEITQEVKFAVADRFIGEGYPVFVIAEIGNNHQGSMSTAIQLVDECIKAGVSCVKFQMRSMEVLYGDSLSRSNDLGVEYTLGLLEKYQLTNDQLFEVMDYAKSRGLVALCTPWDIESARELNAHNVDAFKVASADLTNVLLIDYLISTHKPLIISTGMSTEAEILMASARLEFFGCKFALLHCNSTYPAPYDQINLKYMNRLSNTAAGAIGYSGHERGWHIALAAVAHGAHIIEKHITLDRNQEGVDHKVSLLPDEFAEMVRQIRDIEAASVGPAVRALSQGEMLNQQSLGKSIYVTERIEAGEAISESKLAVRSPGGGFKPYEMKSLLGKVASRAILESAMLTPSDFSEKVNQKRSYKFSRTFGIPVRYHDLDMLLARVDVPLVEFHLSAKDMYADLSTVFKDKYEGLEFAVHCPELFDDDHLLDLAASSTKYRMDSIENVKRTIEVCHGLKGYFGNASENTKLVINCGGWNVDGFVSDHETNKKYDLLCESLSAIDLDGIQLCIQTMPPFPWHFGGQSYHNLFVKPEEISAFLDRGLASVNLCFDVSHTLMAANYLGFDFYESIAQLGKHISHLHISDAEGSSGEGVPFGEGVLNIDKMADLFNVHCPKASFIPEVWQGHRDRGAGFWRALDVLNHKL